jgi:hypothetical protein
VEEKENSLQNSKPRSFTHLVKRKFWRYNSVSEKNHDIIEEENTIRTLTLDWL